MKSLLSASLGLALFAAAGGAAAAESGTQSGGTQYLETEGGRIAYDDSGGNGPVVIALPGMGDLRSQYRYLRPHLSGAGYRVVTMDVRGQGESSIAWRDYSAHAAGRDVLALMKKLNAQSAVVIGNSFAAGAATWAAHLAPDKVRGTVLIGPIMRDIPASPWVAAAIKVGFAGPWRNWFWMSYWDSLFPARKPADHAQYRARLSASLREPGRMAALEKMVHLSKADTDAILDRNRVPTLILMGSKDADFPNPAQEAQLLASRMRAKAVLIEGAGHYPQTEMVEQVAHLLEQFLQQLNRTEG